MPSRQLWQGSVIGMLQSQHTLVDGGWWHDQRVLASTGAGLAEEEPKAWQGWWNEQIVTQRLALILACYILMIPRLTLYV